MLLEAFKRCRLFSKLLLENTERLGLISRFACYCHRVSSCKGVNPRTLSSYRSARYKTLGKKLRSSSWQIDKVCIFIVINNLQGQSDVYLSRIICVSLSPGDFSTYQRIFFSLSTFQFLASALLVMLAFFSALAVSGSQWQPVINSQLMRDSASPVCLESPDTREGRGEPRSTRIRADN